MNIYSWYWLAAGSIATVLIIQLIKYLTRVHQPYPEDVFLLRRPLDPESLRSTFNRSDAENESTGRPRRAAAGLMLSRFVASLEFFVRMKYNAWLIMLCAKRDLASIPGIEDYQNVMAEAEAKSKAAEACERDARLPEFEQQSAELILTAAALRGDSDQLKQRAEVICSGSESRRSQISAVFALATELQQKAGRQQVKICLIIVLLRVDPLAVLPAKRLIDLWHTGTEELLRLYEDVSLNAQSYLSKRQALQDAPTQ